MGPKVNKSEANRKQTIFQRLFLRFVVEERKNVAVSLLSTVHCSVSIFKLYTLKYLNYSRRPPLFVSVLAFVREMTSL